MIDSDGKILMDRLGRERALMYMFLNREFDDILLDYSRQRATLDTIDKLLKLAEVSLVAY